MKKITIKTIGSWKENSKPFSVVTAYDYTSAKIINDSNIPIILVGDSASMVTYGFSSTIPVTMDEMILVCRAVAKACSSTFVVGDMPFLSYQSSVATAIKNAGLILKRGMAEAVKLEGGVEVKPQIKKIVSSGIPVMGHIGLTPQSVNQLSGHRIQGKDIQSAQKIIDDARAVEDAGAFAVVLECIPSELSKLISDTLSIPTIGIGAGPHCDGQVQVWHDILGLINNFHPKHAKKYLKLSDNITKALNQYNSDVANKKFPEKKHTSLCSPNIIKKIK
ncbi:MAG: 3-methyl-2-oxobutanoate hydroxymethyltransferase [Candidatus Marinimicrobia bacterium]|nr:3-methyl-2-oxobutanoate hydroxymethyltransferase [Candidatus Neomarinimicrobiota bacterium]